MPLDDPDGLNPTEKALIILLRRARRLRHAGIKGEQLNHADRTAGRALGVAVKTQDLA